MMTETEMAAPSVPLDRVFFQILLAIVLLAPLPFACNRPWSWSLLSLLVGMLLAAWGAALSVGRVAAPLGLKRLWPVALPFLLATVWSALQGSGLTPAAWQHPIWQEAQAALGHGGGLRGMISVDPERTWTALMRLLAYGGVFLLAAQLGRDRDRAHAALKSLAIAGVAYAVYGLLVYLSGSETILGIPKWAYIGDLTSTFVNHNAYGAYAGVGYLCCMALFANGLRHAGRYQPRANDIAELLLLRTLPYLGGASLAAAAVVLSHSRAALGCTGLGLVVLLSALLVARIIRARAALAGCLTALLVAGLVFLASGDATLKRFRTDGVTDDQRANLYRLTAAALWDAPYTGVGFGDFAPAFGLYRDISLLQPVVFEQAHDVHLEIALELGLPVALIFYAGLGYVVMVCGAGLLRRRRDQIYPAAALSAAILLAAHGIVDFSVQTPAVAVTLALLLGIGFAQSWNKGGA